MEAAYPYQIVAVGRRADEYLVDDLTSTPQLLSAAELVAAWMREYLDAAGVLLPADGLALPPASSSGPVRGR